MSRVTNTVIKPKPVPIGIKGASRSSGKSPGRGSRMGDRGTKIPLASPPSGIRPNRAIKVEAPVQALSGQRRPTAKCRRRRVPHTDAEFVPVLKALRIKAPGFNPGIPSPPNRVLEGRRSHRSTNSRRNVQPLPFPSITLYRTSLWADAPPPPGFSQDCWRSFLTIPSASPYPAMTEYLYCQGCSCRGIASGLVPWISPGG